MKDVTVMFAPLNGVSYYLYERKENGSKFMSLIAPNEWRYNYYKLKFCGAYVCDDGDWEPA
jgi:hypothetical protein